MTPAQERHLHQRQIVGELLLPHDYATYIFLGRINCLVHIAPPTPGLPCKALCGARLAPCAVAYYTEGGHPVYHLRWTRAYCQSRDDLAAAHRTGLNLPVPIRVLCPSCYARFCELRGEGKGDA